MKVLGNMVKAVTGQHMNLRAEVTQGTESCRAGDDSRRKQTVDTFLLMLMVPGVIYHLCQTHFLTQLC